jgi:endonuclease I/subtilisin-like proprotein convertase family protein
MNVAGLPRTAPRFHPLHAEAFDRRSTPAAPSRRSLARREDSGFDAGPSRGNLARLGAAPVVPSRAASAPSRAASFGGTLVHSTRPLAPIEDHQTVTSHLDVPEKATVEALKLNLDLAHTWRGDLVVTLTSPSGRSAVVSNREGGSADDLRGEFDLSAFAGEPTEGRWTLTVEDKARRDTGTLEQWGLSIQTRATEPEDPFAGLRDAALQRALKDSSAGKRVPGYNEARRILFGDLDVKEGQVRCVYTHREIRGGRVPDNSDMNVEHTWPQSKGATGDAKSDLHHLFPTDSRANATRGNHPFGEVVNVKWSHPSGARLGTDAQGRTVFEPPDEHKGNVARAMFYFSTEYQKPIPNHEEAVLKRWNHQDAVDTAEIERNRRIASLQGNRNPFVEHAHLADRIRDF